MSVFEDGTFSVDSRPVSAETAPDILANLQKFAKWCQENNKSVEEAVQLSMDRLGGEMRALQEQLTALRAAQASRPSFAESDQELKGFVTPVELRLDKGQGTGRVVGAGDLLLRGYYDKETASYCKGLLDQNLVVTNDWALAFRRAVSRLNLAVGVRGSIRQCPKASAALVRVLKGAPDSIRKAPAIQALIKAFVDNSGSGAEWIIDMGLADLYDNNPIIRGQVESLFRVVPMNDGTELIPAMTTSLRPYLYGATSLDDPAPFKSSTITTEQRSRTAKGLAVLAKLDRDASEDAIIAAGPIVNQRLSEALRDGKEDAIVNGDTASSHLHTALSSFSPRNRWGSTGLGGSDDHRRAWDGLIKIGQTNASGAGNVSISGGTYNDIVSIFSKMTGAGGAPGSQTAVITSKKAYHKIIVLDEYKKFDAVQGLGTNEGGAPGLQGFPIALSDFVSDELNASGVFDNVSKDKTSVIAVNLDRVVMAERQGVVVETDVDIARNQNLIVGRYRGTLHTYGAVDSSDNNVDVAVGYNLTS